MKKLYRQFIGNFHTMSRIYNDGYRLIKFLNNEKIDTVFDVGANTGQYALMLRRFGYKGKIISFEPLKKEKNILDVNMAEDKNFESYNYAIGKKNADGKINYALNSVSSSILTSHPRNKLLDKGVVSEEKYKIKIKKLINFKKKIKKNTTMLKLDTQGFEYEILFSSKNLLNRFKLIKLEISYRRMYYSAKDWLKILDLLQKKGFYVIDVFYGSRNKKNSELMESDFILKRN